MTFRTNQSHLPAQWFIILFNCITVLTFANSMLNPFLYAFLSDNFRKSFMKAFKCASPREVNKSLCNENSVFPKNVFPQRGRIRLIKIDAQEVLLSKLESMGNKILGTIHIYPTLAEANKYAAGNWKKSHTPEKLLGWVERFHAWRRS